MLTFIPYIADDKEPRRRRELQLSTVRSHAAQRSYPWRKQNQSRRQTPHVGNEHPAGLCSSSDQSCQDRLVAERRPLKRSADWHFGSLGATCRAVGDLDVTALKFYHRQPLTQTMSAEIVSRCHLLPVELSSWSPFIQETVQRATRDSTMLDSLVSSTIILMADTYMNNKSLISAGHKLTQHAVHALRVSIQTDPSADPLSVQLSSMHLCMGSLRAGDIDAARTHLRFLEATVTKLDPQKPYHVDVLNIIRFCDVWLALESGEAPSRSLQPQMSLEQEAQLNPSGSPYSGEFDISVRTENSRAPEQVSDNLHKLPESDTIYPCRFNSSITDRRSHFGLLRAAASGLLSVVTPGMIENYVKAVDYISESAHKETANLEDFEPMIGKCLDSLCQLCFAYDRTQHNVHLSSGQQCSNQRSSSLSNATSSTDFDELVVLALQIQLVIRLGRFVHRNREKLSGRLIKSLLQNSHLPYYKPTENGGDGATVVPRDQLYLWVLLTGMLGTPKDSNQLEWYKIKAPQTLKAIGITTEIQLENAIAPFLPAPIQFDFGFRKLAKELIANSVTPKSRSPIQ